MTQLSSCGKDNGAINVMRSEEDLVGSANAIYNTCSRSPRADLWKNIVVLRGVKA